MTKKDYILAAEIVRTHKSLDNILNDGKCGSAVMRAFIAFFTRDNPKFDEARFIAACEEKPMVEGSRRSEGDSGAAMGKFEVGVGAGAHKMTVPACCKAGKCGSCNCNHGRNSAGLKMVGSSKKV